MAYIDTNNPVTVKFNQDSFNNLYKKRGELQGRIFEQFKIVKDSNGEILFLDKKEKINDGKKRLSRKLAKHVSVMAALKIFKSEKDEAPDRKPFLKDLKYIQKKGFFEKVFKIQSKVKASYIEELNKIETSHLLYNNIKDTIKFKLEILSRPLNIKAEEQDSSLSDKFLKDEKIQQDSSLSDKFLKDEKIQQELKSFGTILKGYCTEDKDNLTADGLEKMIDLYKQIAIEINLKLFGDKRKDQDEYKIIDSLGEIVILSIDKEDILTIFNKDSLTLIKENIDISREKLDKSEKSLRLYSYLDRFNGRINKLIEHLSSVYGPGKLH